MEKNMKTEEPQEKAQACGSAVERLVGFPKLRLRICFDLDLDSLLSRFKSNPTQTIPLSVSCGVEKLRK